MKTSCIGNLVLGLSVLIATAAYGATSGKPKANAVLATESPAAPTAPTTAASRPKQQVKAAAAAKPHVASKQSKPAHHLAAKPAATKATQKWTPKATAAKHHNAKHVAWTRPRAKAPAVWKAPKGHVSAHKSVHTKGKKIVRRTAATVKKTAKTAAVKMPQKSKKGLHAKPLGKMTHKIARKHPAKVTNNAKFAGNTNVGQESSNGSWLALFIAFIAACVGGLLYMKKKKQGGLGLNGMASGAAAPSSEMPLTSSMSHLELSRVSGMGPITGHQPETGAKGFGGDGKTNVTGRPKSA